MYCLIMKTYKNHLQQILYTVSATINVFFFLGAFDGKAWSPSTPIVSNDWHVSFLHFNDDLLKFAEE